MTPLKVMAELLKINIEHPLLFKKREEVLVFDKQTISYYYNVWFVSINISLDKYIHLLLQDREFVDMDLPFNGVNLTAKRQGSAGSRPASPGSVEMMQSNCFSCCPPKQEQKQQQSHAVILYFFSLLIHEKTRTITSNSSIKI